MHAEIPIILNFNDTFTFQSIELLLFMVKEKPKFQILNKSLRNRIYSIVVECAENIKKYSADEYLKLVDKSLMPHITLRKHGEDFIITAGNPVLNKKLTKLRNRLEEIDRLSMSELKALYGVLINKDIASINNGAGLGLITIAMKACKEISYDIIPVNDNYSFFEISVIINKCYE